MDRDRMPLPKETIGRRRAAVGVILAAGALTAIAPLSLGQAVRDPLRGVGQKGPAAAAPQVAEAPMQRAGQLVQKAMRLEDAGKLAEAVDALREVVHIQQQHDILNDEVLADLFGWLAEDLIKLRRYGEAADARSSELDALTALPGALAWEVADARTSLATLRVIAGFTPEQLNALAAVKRQYETVLQLYEQQQVAAAIQEGEKCLAEFVRLFGEGHLETADVLNDLGAFSLYMGDYEKALERLHAARSIFERDLGRDHGDTARALNNLGSAYRAMGNYASARECLAEALRINLAMFGENHLETATALNNVGFLLFHVGEYVQAKDHLQRALAAAESEEVADEGLKAQALNSLALLFEELGDPRAARDCFESSLVIRRRLFPNGSIETARSLNGLGSLLGYLGEFASAKVYLEEALALQRAFLGEHSETCVSLNNLGSLMLAMGNLEEAKNYLDEALTMQRELLGDEHPNVAATLSLLGHLNAQAGDLVAAQELHEQAAEMFHAALGENHPHAAEAFNNLALVAAARGDFALSWKFFDQTFSAREAFADEQLPRLTDGQMQALLATTRGELDAMLSLPVADRPAAATFEWVLRQKARVYYMQSRLRAVQALLAADPDVARRVQDLQMARQRLNDLAMHPPDDGDKAAAQRNRHDLQADIAHRQEDLNALLADRLGEIPDESVTLEAIRQSLPEGGALIEFVNFTPFDFEASRQESPWGAPRYAAFVLKAGDSEPAWVDLGDAQEIDDLIQELADRMDDAAGLPTSTEESQMEASYRAVARDLYARIFAPLAIHSAEVKRIFLSPDDKLHSVPFEALVGDDGQYLVEAGYSFAYLTSGRDLLRQHDQRVDVARGVAIFAGPNYDMPHSDRFAAVSRLLARMAAAPSAASQDGLASANDGIRGDRPIQLRGRGWTLLPGMTAEGAAARDAFADAGFGDVSLYSADDALEEVIKQMEQPRILIFATHADYLDEQMRAAATTRGLGDAALGRGPFAVGQGVTRLMADENPLYWSFLVLAGANTLDEPVPPGVAVDDGWLTADEISQLELHGTELVVLSACESNQGQATAGEAVAGMRSAFLFAGAHTLVGSLYAVPDRATRDLMQRFYAGVAASDGQPGAKLAALNAARLAFIQERRRARNGAAHPFFWASFVLIGEP